MLEKNEKNENKQKEAGIGPFKNNDDCLCKSCGAKRANLFPENKFVCKKGFQNKTRCKMSPRGVSLHAATI